MIIHTKTTLKSYNLDIEVEISEKSIGTVTYEVCSNFTQDKKKNERFKHFYTIEFDQR